MHVKGLQAYRGEWGGGCGSSGDVCVDAGGHAAHFANIDQGSPMFSQERAPTSVAYAENQSMFLDSFIDDAAWKGRYALSRYLLHLEALPFTQSGIICLVRQVCTLVIACSHVPTRSLLTAQQAVYIVSTVHVDLRTLS